MLFYYRGPDGSVIPADDVGTLTKITNSCVGPIETIDYFAFIANGSGEDQVTYAEFEKVLKAADDTSIVYFIDKTITVPQVDDVPVAVDCAYLEVDRLTSLSSKAAADTKGTLTVVKNPPSSSSSSS